MKKSGFVLSIVLLFVFLGFFGNVDADVCDGDISVHANCNITSCANFSGLVSYFQTHPGYTYVIGLNNDIDCSGYNINSLGSATSPFENSSFNGNGHTISNVTISNVSSFSLGIFGVAKNIRVKNLTMTNLNVIGSGNVGAVCGQCTNVNISNVYIGGTVRGSTNVGGLVGNFSNSNISNSYFIGNVTGTTYVGGLIGSSKDIVISNSFSVGNLSGIRNVGGFIGMAYSGTTISDSYSTKTIFANASQIGGFVGQAPASSNVNIQRSYYNGVILNKVTGGIAYGGLIGQSSGMVNILQSSAGGSISGIGLINIGGFIGQSLNRVDIQNSSSSMDINGTGGNIGGFVGYASATTSIITILYSNNTGNINGYSDYIGGLIGFAGVATSTIGNSFSSGNINGETSSDYVGGLIGKDYYKSLIYNSYSLGNVNGLRYIGGLVGYLAGNITQSFFNGNVSGQGFVGGLAGQQGSVSVGGRGSSGMSKIDGSYFKGRVNGTNKVAIIYPYGGLVGNQEFGSIIYSFARGEVTVNSSSHLNVGGLVGSQNGKINDSYFYGNVSSTTVSTYINNVAGLVGKQTGSTALISKSYSITNVYGSGGTLKIGGLVADCYSPSTCNNILWAKIDSANNQVSYGTPDITPQRSPLLLDNMMTSDSYSANGFTDFSTIWNFTSSDYPYAQFKWYLGQLNTELDNQCRSAGKIFIFPIANTTLGSGSAIFNITTPDNRGCKLTIGTAEFLNTTSIKNDGQNNTINYNGLSEGDYSAEVKCGCGSGEDSAIKSTVMFNVLTSSNNELRFKNLRGVNLDLSSPVSIGDTVVVHLGGNIGTLVNYTINKSNAIVATGQTNRGFAYFTVRSVGIYSLSMSNNSGVTWSYSTIGMNVSTIENNQKPSVEITNPSSDIAQSNNIKKFAEGFIIPFAASVYDLYDLLDINWNFGDGNQTKLYGFSEYVNLNANINHSYSSAGVYKVILNAKEIETNRGKDSSSYRDVRVLRNGLNVFPTISKPEDDGSLSNNPWVELKAGSIGLSNCSSALSGTCSEGLSITDDLLLCCNDTILDISTNGISNNYRLYFDWDLGNGLHRTGYLNETNYNNVANFLAHFNNDGSQNIKLTIRYEPSGLVTNGVNGSISRQFYTGVTDFECISTPSYSFWQNITSNDVVFWVFNDSASPDGMCNNRTFMSHDWCCPTDMLCTGDGVCEFPERGTVSCSEMTDATSCNGASSDVAEGLFNLFPPENYSGICNSNGTFSSYLGGDDGISLCSNMTYCGCTWNEEEDFCSSSLIYESSCGEITTNYSCNWAQQGEAIDHCDEADGKLIITYAATFDNGDFGDNSLCQDQIVEYPCSVSVQLPFFDGVNFIFAVLAIAGIYCFMKRR